MYYYMYIIICIYILYVFIYYMYVCRLDVKLCKSKICFCGVEVPHINASQFFHFLTVLFLHSLNLYSKQKTVANNRFRHLLLYYNMIDRIRTCRHWIYLHVVLLRSSLSNILRETIGKKTIQTKSKSDLNKLYEELQIWSVLTILKS